MSASSHFYTFAPLLPMPSAPRVATCPQCGRPDDHDLPSVPTCRCHRPTPQD